MWSKDEWKFPTIVYLIRTILSTHDSQIQTKTTFFLRKIFNSHLFWLNSHPSRACLVLRACRSAAFLDHDAKKGCEFNQKRCEFKIFLFFIVEIIICLCQCRLRAKNLGLLVFLLKISPMISLLVLTLKEDLKMWMGLVKIRKTYWALMDVEFFFYEVEKHVKNCAQN